MENKVENLVLRSKGTSALPHAIKEDVGNLLYSLVTEGNNNGVPDKEDILAEDFSLYLSNLLYDVEGELKDMFDCEQSKLMFAKDPYSGIAIMESDLKDYLISIIEESGECLLCLHSMETPPVTTMVDGNVIILTWV